MVGLSGWANLQANDPIVFVLGTNCWGLRLIQMTGILLIVSLTFFTLLLLSLVSLMSRYQNSSQCHLTFWLRALYMYIVCPVWTRCSKLNCLTKLLSTTHSLTQLMHVCSYVHCTLMPHPLPLGSRWRGSLSMLRRSWPNSQCRKRLSSEEHQ